MHCWLRALISVWAHIYLLLAVTLYFARSHPLLSNITTVPLNDDTDNSLTTEENKTTSDTEFNTTAFKLNQTVLDYGSNTSDSEIDKLPVLEFNTTTTVPLTATTNATGSSEHGDEPHPSINLAIIPALAILVFLIVFCIRCCKWFRSYTRGGDKEDGNHYASIVQQGDEDYGQVDIMSDTTSTVYNDTVSSYCSFLKRNGNDNTINSFRSLKGDNIRQNTPKGDHPGRLSTKNERKMYEYSLQPDKSPGSAGGPCSSGISRGARTLSASSEETEPLTGSFSDSSDAQQQMHQSRKAQRFKVSFVDSLDEKPGGNTPRPTKRNIITSTSEFSPNLDDRLCYRSSLKRGHIMSPGQSRHQSAVFRVSHSEKSTPVEEEVVFVEKYIKRLDDRSAVATDTVSVGVQTDKSFRYNLWKSKRRYFSDPGHDSSDDHEMDELTTTCSSPQKRARGVNENALKPFLTETSKNSTTPCHSNNSVCEDVGDSLTVNSALGSSPSDSNDDVFDMCEVPSVRYCNCSVPECNNKAHKGTTGGEMVPAVDIKQLEQDHNENKDTCEGSCHLSRPLMLKTLKECNEQNDGKFPICSKCKSAVVVLEGHQSSHLLVHNCDNLYICDICFKNRTAGIQNGRMINGIDKENLLESVSSKDHGDLIIGTESKSIMNDMTSSMTSLESSGYAELSSESSN